MPYQIKHWHFSTLIVFLSSINFSFIAGSYRENLALRHPCNSMNKRLGPYISWTEKLASSQYKGELYQLFLTHYFFSRVNILIDNKNQRCISTTQTITKHRYITIESLKNM